MQAARKWWDRGGEVRKSRTVRDHEQEVGLPLRAMRLHGRILSRGLAGWEVCVTKIIAGPEVEDGLDAVKREVVRRLTPKVPESHGQALHRRR